MEGHGTEDIDKYKQVASSYTLSRGKFLTDQEAEAQTDYKRYDLSSADGVSPRTIPGQKGGIHLAGSDEHDERGLYNEEADVRIRMMDKRFNKLQQAIADGMFAPPVIFGPADAPLTIIAIGTTKFPILEAMKWLEKENIHINYLQVSYLSPFPEEFVADIMKKAKKTLVIENNKLGQFEGIVAEHTGLRPNHHLRKYDGRPFYPEEIVAFVKSILTGSAVEGARPVPSDKPVPAGFSEDQAKV